MRGASATLVIILMMVILVLGVLWFYGYHSDTTHTVNRVEKIKFTQKETLVNALKHLPTFSKECRDHQEREQCIKNRLKNHILLLLQQNIH